LSAAKVNLALRLIIFADHAHGRLGRAHIADGVVYKAASVLSTLYVVYTVYAEALAITGVFNTTRLGGRDVVIQTSELGTEVESTGVTVVTISGIKALNAGV
jgi:hypothetical protein